MLLIYTSKGRCPREALAVEKVGFQTRKRKILYILSVMRRGKVRMESQGNRYLLN